MSFFSKVGQGMHVYIKNLSKKSRAILFENAKKASAPRKLSRKKGCAPLGLLLPFPHHLLPYGALGFGIAGNPFNSQADLEPDLEFGILLRLLQSGQR